MTPLDRVPGVVSELAAFLNAVGIESAEDLSNANESSLQRELEQLGRKRGRASLVPSVITVKLWIASAKELVKSGRAAEPELHEIPELINLDDIPEAEMEEFSELPAAPGTSRSPTPLPRSNKQDNFSPKVAAKGIGKQLPPSKDSPANAESWKALDKSRFQTISDYNGASRGIVPLKRAISPTTHTTGRVVVNSSGALSRTTRRGVLYPNPWKAIFGAIFSLIWRIAFFSSCILLPLFLYQHSEKDSRPIAEISLWVGGLLFLGCFQLWAATKVRCRICSCHLFHSRRCFKNSKAHLIHGLGYVGSLALHLLLFQWFRCMYCGTAVRLFSGKSKALAAVEEE